MVERGMILKAENICKRFGATVALDHAQVELRSGEVHSLVGENGAGKSTLLKVIAAVYKPDSGIITIDDKPFAAKNFLDATKQGVAIVFQESTINPYISVAENIYIDRLHEYARPVIGLDWKRLRTDAQAVLNSMEAQIDVNCDIRSLDLGQWKLIEVARALSYNPSVLLLDESTAFLNSKEVKAFLNIVRNLRQKGLAIGFVSHHMNEIFEISDKITVMLDGKFVINIDGKDATNEILESAMVGRTVSEKLYPVKSTTKGNVALEVRNLSIPGELEDVSFNVRKGEILGIGGLKGSGGEAILNAIYGTEALKSGEFEYNSEVYSSTTPNKSLARKIAMVPGERTLEGLITDFSIRDNIVMSLLPRKGLLRDVKAEAQTSKRYVEKIHIKTTNDLNPVNSLSGGNMQKVVLGKCLAAEPNILLLNNPTRGIDISSRQEIYALVRELANEGMSIIMLTEDLLELLGMSDRIMIMKKNRISKIFEENINLQEKDVIGYIV